MYPILMELGEQPIYSYWFFYGLGMLFGALLCIWLGCRRSLLFWKLWVVCFMSIIGAFICARLSFVIFDPTFDPFSNLIYGGEISFGGFIGAVLMFFITAVVLGMPLSDVLDACAPSIFLAQGIQRLGCYCNGCCHGPIVNSFLSVRFPKIINPQGDIIGTPCFLHHLATGVVDRTDLYSLPVFPMQFVSMVIVLTLASIGTWMFLKRRFQGRVLWLSFAVYGAIRFCLQWFRPNYDANNAVSGWNIGHSASLFICFIGLGVFILIGKGSSFEILAPRYKSRKKL